MNRLIPRELNSSDPESLLKALRQLRKDVFDEGQATFARWHPLIQSRDYLISALNLAYYLALRRRDLRPLQNALQPWGLSSLGRSESRVMPSLDAVIATLSQMSGEDTKRPSHNSFKRGQRLLQRHTEAVFGEQPEGRKVR